MSDRATRSAPRRRRSWYRRRLRIQRSVGAAAVLAVIAVVSWQNVARILHLPTLHPAQILPDSFWAPPTMRQDLVWTPPHEKSHPKYIARIPGMYPYSVIPGGVKDLEALRKAAALDRAIARHYAHFDYSKARLERVTEPREVYVSYRIRDTIFWTGRKVRLHVGEMLLTDGNITARARCGNQVSDTPKPDISKEEPEQDILDQPVALEPMGPSSPIRPLLAPPDLPTGEPMAPKLFANGFAFPYAPLAAGMISGQACKFLNGDIDKKCVPHRRKKLETPEPSTILLLTPGLAFIFWRFRTNRRSATV